VRISIEILPGISVDPAVRFGKPRKRGPKEQQLVIHGDPQAALSKLLLRTKDR
jgi:hypothetical protein